MLRGYAAAANLFQMASLLRCARCALSLRAPARRLASVADEDTLTGFKRPPSAALPRRSAEKTTKRTAEKTVPQGRLAAEPSPVPAAAEEQLVILPREAYVNPETGEIGGYRGPEPTKCATSLAHRG